MLTVLVIDDERPAAEDLAWALRRDPRVGQVRTATDAAAALAALDADPVEAVFLDVRMPQLDGLAVAAALNRLPEPPAVVFVTAYDEHAVDAFDLAAVDYLLKPVRPERLREAIRRVQAARGGGAHDGDDDESIAVERGGVTRFVARSQVRWVEAHGDYARLHTDTGTHLVRTPLGTLEQRWAHAGFVRVHRRTLVAMGHVEEVRFEPGRALVRLDTGESVAVARRHVPELRDLIVRGDRPRRQAARD